MEQSKIIDTFETYQWEAGRWPFPSASARAGSLATLANAGLTLFFSKKPRAEMEVGPAGTRWACQFEKNRNLFLLFIIYRGRKH